jgi:hypothetical protein
MRAYLLLAAFTAVLAVAVANASSRHTYPVDWMRRYKAEHGHVHRLLPALAEARANLAEERSRIRHVQAVDWAPTVDAWRARQIAAATTIAQESSGDPWPSCPDPYDGSGASWDDTVNCENSGDWLDSPGYYRCGLQFDPMWERRFGRLCP